jgi:hypothetical protein
LTLGTYSPLSIYPWALVTGGEKDLLNTVEGIVQKLAKAATKSIAVIKEQMRAALPTRPKVMHSPKARNDSPVTKA